MLQEAAARLELLTGYQPCRAFRPHAGNRSVPMIAGAARAGYLVVGWGWMLWDFNWFKARNADDLVRGSPTGHRPVTSSSSTTGTTWIRAPTAPMRSRRSIA